VPGLTVRLGTETRRLSFSPGQSLLDLLAAAEIPIRAACTGLGACGLCRIRIAAGAVDPPEPIECLYLDDEALAAGMRLACRVMPTTDLEIEIPTSGVRPVWRFLEVQDRTSCPGPVPAAREPGEMAPLGVAVDLGTTYLSVLLCDLDTGRWLAGCRGHNPQSTFGADILTRLAAAVAAPAAARRMRHQTIAAIGSALWHLAVRQGVSLERIGAVTLVGNTAMSALVSGQHLDRLIEPRHWAEAVEWLPPDTGDWALAWGLLPGTRILAAPPLAGLIGSDLLAGVLATGLTEAADGGGHLLIDFGTNSELALWDGAVLWCTSAAGGPAFECSGMRCGYPAEPGAIARVRFRGETPDYRVIGGGAPRGLCGSGLVDLIAGLRRTGRLDERGRFAPDVPPAGYALGQGQDPGAPLVLSSADVDLLQRAKAAIGVGIMALLAKAGMRYADLRRLCVGGTFGHALDIPNARALGLLPPLPAERIELCGNTALAGCADLLVQPARLARLQALSERARVINLAQYADFEAAFLDHLYLRQSA
jgi:uncharacterized 2Fe-2S/4Fe-4S cluster protein (DUF4445 family)